MHLKRGNFASSSFEGFSKVSVGSPLKSPIQAYASVGPIR
jgi:hypothetical protein